ncbi:diphthine methyl ester synthase isoform X2 [Zootermopsis nevadensis]|uniref:diphthine methyl ester synthase isoform X2 n=1 Tax=Zootermopsis nevadensis TaxID=136037 RepID=UPI000B8ED21B|nr:diphthine methyl ester synthase isoform X2 [Zootermopsis nevadensis]
MFFIIGLGLGEAEDITVKGLEIVKKAERVYLEVYTSILTVGDPFGATTHTDLVLRAREAGITCKIIHNASILNAVGCCGLQLYSFGETVSIPYWSESWQPDSFYDKIAGNRRRGLHTLCLLDIRVKEPTLESLTKKRKEYQPPRFMSVSEAAGQLLEIISRRHRDHKEFAYTGTTLCVGVARVGSDTQQILACTLQEMKDADLGPPLHSLIIAGHLHPLEVEYLTQFSESKEKLLQIAKTS